MIIGLFVLIGSFLIVAIILFIQPSIGDGKQTLKVRFNNINGINVGTRVTYAGREIGEVSEIHQVRDARQKASDHFGEVYPYILTLKIDSSYVIYSTDEIIFQTKGLLGERYIAIIPKAIKSKQLSKIVTSKDIMYADSTDLLESAMNEVAALSEKFEEVLNRVIQWIDKYGDDLGSAVKSFDVTIAEAGKTLKDFNRLKIINDVKKITSDIAAGKGTLGRIISEDGLYLQVNAILTKTNTLLNDINQYGLMFQYNKQWQRRRVKLMSEADKIKNPKAFQMYMDQEIDQINTTLSRMNSLAEQFDIESLANNRYFRCNFKELMQQLHDLQSRVDLYNQELNEARCQNP